MQLTASDTAAPPDVPVETSSHFAPLDGLRGLAILLIVFHHAWTPAGGRTGVLNWLYMVNKAGWVGVTLFFVLSGFLIGGILIDSRGSPGYFRTFYIRRSLRIFPLYYLFLFVVFYVSPLLLRALGYYPVEFSVKYTFFCYLANYNDFLGITTAPGIIDPLWSLSVEEQVYLIWPAIIALCPPNRLVRLMGIVFVASLLWRVGALAAHWSIMMAYSWTPACLDAFAAGTIVAALTRSRQSQNVLASQYRAWFAGGAFFVLGMAIGQGHFLMWLYPKTILSLGLTAVSIASAAGIGLLVTAPNSPVARFFSAGWLRSLGKYSYAIYLVHMPVRAWVNHVTTSLFDDAVSQTSGFQFGVALVVLAISFAVAMLTWNLVEQPFLKLKRFFPTRGRGVPVPQ